MITLDQFKSIADRTSPGISRGAEQEDGLRYVGLTFQGVYTRQMVTDELQARLSKAVIEGQKRAAQHVTALIDELVQTHEVTGAARDPYYEILGTIRDALRSGALDGQCTVDWEAIVQAAVDISEWTGVIHLPQYKILNVAQIASAGAAKRRARIGASGKRDEVSPQKNRAAIAGSIERAIAHIGGIEVARGLVRMLEPTFDSRMERYLDREVFSFGGGPLQPRIPFGYLLNIAAKYPVARNPVRRTAQDWRNLIDLSKDFALLYRVQSATYMENMFASETTLLPLLRRISVRDSLFSPAQLRPSDVVRVLRGLLHAASQLPKVPSAVIAASSQTVDVIESVLGLTTIREPLRLKAQQIADGGKNLPLPTVDRIVREVLSHSSKACNRNFRRPDEEPNSSLPRDRRAGANFTDRPLISLGADEYLLLSLPFSTSAMLEAVLTQLRAAKVDEVMGLAIEGFLLQELQKHGITVSTGKYAVGKQTFECDIVIETERRVVFMETKKKSLTRAARAGMDTALLVDIADSLVSATLQAMRHEDRLKRGPLVLVQKDGTSKTIELNGRDVERIAITLHDYGGFQDRLLLQAILDTQMRLEFTTDDPEFKKKIERMNESMEELRTVNKSLWDLAGQPSTWRPFLASWFLSVPQFLVLLDPVTGPDQFDVELGRTRQMTTGHKDFYVDLHFARQLNVRGAP